MFHGHIVATAEDFTTSAFSTVEKDILNGSMANSFFPEPDQLFEQFQQEWIRCATHYRNFFLITKMPSALGYQTSACVLLPKLRQWAPEPPVFHGHSVATAEDFTTSAFSTVEKDILNGSMANSFFPEPDQLFEQFQQEWIRWCRANDLPGPPQGLREVFNHLHVKHHLAAQGRYRAEAVRSIRIKTKAAIWHCEDHRARQAVCYCLCLYHKALSGTFENPAIFKEPGASFEQQLPTLPLGFSKPNSHSCCLHSSEEEDRLCLGTTHRLIC